MTATDQHADADDHRMHGDLSRSAGKRKAKRYGRSFTRSSTAGSTRSPCAIVSIRMAYIAEFLANTHYLSAIERYTPGLLDEVPRNRCRAPRCRSKTMLAYNLMATEASGARDTWSLSPG